MRIKKKILRKRELKKRIGYKKYIVILIDESCEMCKHSEIRIKDADENIFCTKYKFKCNGNGRCDKHKY